MNDRTKRALIEFGTVAIVAVALAYFIFHLHNWLRS